MLPRVHKDIPGLTLHLYFGSGDDLVLRVRTLEIDCAVPSTRLTDPKLDSAKLHMETYCFVGARKLIERTPFNTAADAANHCLIDTTEELPLFQEIRRHGTVRELTLVVETLRAVSDGRLRLDSGQVLDGIGSALPGGLGLTAEIDAAVETSEG